ncbi:hypothetical protein CP97_07855 [Aurantiacibacter atlanticus]|uniref:Lipoprotein-related protein n=1 Tax=Aurantiacibacter atlanticus TaxID=1648404 RepID=A0A0H4VC26_9SPHN|nr:YbaY family lipoprotein [Aurantiacibacter atlanticus]AKQ41960.1 hypothetical protein CP97_07855 [Aurantiacibacter atlanticus]
MRLYRFLGVTSLLLASACSTAYGDERPSASAHAESAQISGGLTYRERIALPPGATAQVQLLEVSRADAPSTVIDQANYDLRGRSVSFGFELYLPAEALQHHAQFAVRGQIRRPDGNLLFTTDTVNRVEARMQDQSLGTIIMVSAR